MFVIYNNHIIILNYSMAPNSESDFRLLPKFIQSKYVMLNPMNKDHCSIGYAIVLSLHPHEWRQSKSKQLLPQRLMELFSQHGLLHKIKYPVQIDDIPALEDQLNIRINVFTFDDVAGYKRHSLYISKQYKPEEVNLLY
jgi:hypothetical protein